MIQFLREKKRRRVIYLSFVVVVFFSFWFSISFPLFNVPYSTVIYSREGKLLGAHIAADGQWRFPKPDSVPEKFISCLLQFEDEHFYQHPGVNPFSIARALYQNIKTKSVVSGGSTITMQVIRLAYEHDRTVFFKCIEMIQALRLELACSKQEILSLYATHAPFGGNIVGLEAASWRYFHRKPYQLSWAENAMLAVLPNAPGLIHTGKNRDLLKRKRDWLLAKMLNNEVIDSMTYRLSVDEPIPVHPYALPQEASHALDFCRKKKEGQIYDLTIDESMQLKVNQIMDFHHKKFSRNEVHNACAIVLDVKTNQILAYYGNTQAINGDWHQNQVDIIQAPRSTGSILKPFLYTGCMQDGFLLPKMLVADIPTYFKNFNPKNYNRTYSGAVPADEALSRSLNVPAVRLLKQYDIGRFCSLLQKVGLTTIKMDPDYYGLSLILGGGEATLFDLSGAYAGMARTLINYTDNSSTYHSNEFFPPQMIVDKRKGSGKNTNTTLVYPVFSAGAIYETFEALTNVARPPEEQGWEYFSSSKKIAWKTGTSYGFRDAWAIGVTPEYVVAVWAGNATGEGRPGIVGGVLAGPILFDIFQSLPKTSWFKVPYDDLRKIPVCKKSGFKAGPYCDEEDSMYVPVQGLKSPLCPYHKRVHLNAEETLQVNSDCYPVSKMHHKNWFVLPPVMEWYYKRNHPLYKVLPPVKKGGLVEGNLPMQFIYPQGKAVLYIPKGLDGKLQSVVLKVAHKNASTTIFWHLDQEYIGQTSFVNQMEIQPTVGWHTITLIDEDGNELTKRIHCVGRGDE